MLPLPRSPKQTQLSSVCHILLILRITWSTLKTGQTNRFLGYPGSSNSRIPRKGHRHLQAGLLSILQCEKLGNTGFDKCMPVSALAQ